MHFWSSNSPNDIIFGCNKRFSKVFKIYFERDRLLDMSTNTYGFYCVNRSTILCPPKFSVTLWFCFSFIISNMQPPNHFFFGPNFFFKSTLKWERTPKFINYWCFICTKTRGLLQLSLTSYVRAHAVSSSAILYIYIKNIL